MTSEKARTILYIVLSFIGLISAIVGVQKYFATRSEVIKIDLQRSIDATDHLITRQEQDIMRFEVEKRTEELSDREKRILDKFELKRDELNRRREQQIEQFQQMR